MKTTILNGTIIYAADVKSQATFSGPTNSDRLRVMDILQHIALPKPVLIIGESTFIAILTTYHSSIIVIKSISTYITPQIKMAHFNISIVLILQLYLVF